MALTTFLCVRQPSGGFAPDRLRLQSMFRRNMGFDLMTLNWSGN